MGVLGQIAGLIVLVGMFAAVCAVAWLYVRRVRRKFRDGMPGGVDPNLAALYRVGTFDVDETRRGHVDREDEDDGEAEGNAKR
jgi:hypothetical protein